MREGYSRWDSKIYSQEGLDKQSLHQMWKDTAESTIDKLLATTVTNQTPYIIPPISHVVYFTDPSNPKPWKELYTNKYTKTTERLSAQDHNMKHYIWTNDPNTVPATVKALPNVEIRTFDEFKNHELIPNLNKLLEEAKADPSKFVQASDVAKVLAEQAYGGIYHDLDYEVFDAAGLIKYMKLASFVGGKEEEGRFDSFMGNAFIASTAHHPVINELAKAIKRNLNLEKGVPDYIKYPLNKFDSVICSTGPMALTLAYFKVQNQEAADDNRLPPQLMLPPKTLYSVDYARQETGSKMINPPPQGAIVGDVFSGNWETDEYKKTLKYPIADLDRSESKKQMSADNIELSKVMEASSRGETDIVKAWISTGADVNVIDDRGRTVLLQAIRGGHHQIVKTLLKAGANVNAVDRYGETPLINAAIYGEVEIVKSLIKAGADVNLADKRGITALMFAAGKGQVQVIESLIKEGADVNLADERGITALIIAASKGHGQVVESLIDAGAYVNAADKNGETPLIYAVKKGRVQIIESLIKEGTDVNAMNVDGKTAMDYAISDEIRNVLTTAINAQETEKAAKTNESQKSEIVVKTGLDADMKFINAVTKGSLDEVKSLLEAETHAKIVSDFGGKALDLAVIRGDPQIVDLLLKAGAPLNVFTAEGQSALMIAVENDNRQIIDLLLKAGANITAVGENGKKAIDYAATPEIKELLTAALEAQEAQVVIKAQEALLPITQDSNTKLITPSGDKNKWHE